MDDSNPKPKSKSGVLALLVTLVILAALVAMVLKIYTSEAESRAAWIESNGAQLGADRVDAFAKIVSADPMKGDVVVRLDFAPQGAFVSEDGVTLSRDLDLFVSSATGKQVHEFRKGKRMTPVEAVLDMYDGDAMDYPFDEHQAQFIMYFEPSAAQPGGATAAIAAAENDEAADVEIPVALELAGAVNGLSIEAEKTKENAADYVEVDLTVRRATTARFFSIFIMTAMWLLTAAVLFLVFHVLTDRRKIEVGMFSFLGALLFAFPALRNSQPGTPPIGTYGDFLAFFWAEVLIALCLLTILSVWLIRGPGGAAKT